MKTFIFLIAVSLSVATTAQTPFEQKLLNQLNAAQPGKTDPFKYTLYPNDAQQGMFIPSGFGGYGAAIYAGVGAVYPELYRNNKLDAIATVGVAFGNPEKFANISAGVNMTSPKHLRNFSGNFQVSRVIANIGSVSAGVMQAFADPEVSDAPDPDFYIAFSRAALPSKTTGMSRLTYTIGYGTDRYRINSPRDTAAGKSLYGTGVFAGVSYEILPRVNGIVEWRGVNLGIALGTRPFKRYPFSVGFGVANLTRFAGDRINFACTMGYGISLQRYKY